MGAVTLLTNRVESNSVNIVVPRFSILSTALVRVGVARLSRTVSNLIINGARILLCTMLTLINFVLTNFRTNLHVDGRRFSFLQRRTSFTDLLIRFSTGRFEFGICGVSVLLCLGVLRLLELRSSEVTFLLGKDDGSNV